MDNYNFRSARGGDYRAANKSQLIKNIRLNLERVVTLRERNHAVDQLSYFKAARVLNNEDFWKLVDVADAALGRSTKKN
tara:strand:+ start:51 stop:287 length:237 start_codon:yes stop_codon:yes gene_type:complete